MKGIGKFIRTSLVGGILFLLPVVVLAIIGGKALAIAGKIIGPLAAHLPFESFIGLDTPLLMAIVLLVLFCFLAGVFARTALAQRGVLWLETTVLSNLPGYEFIRSVSGNLLGDENQAVYPVVLVRIEDAWQIGFLIERLEGGHVTVFVSGAPSPQSGSVYFMTEDRIQLLDIPPQPALKCLKRYGLGANALLGDRLQDGEVTAESRKTKESMKTKRTNMVLLALLPVVLLPLVSCLGLNHGIAGPQVIFHVTNRSVIWIEKQE